MNPRTIAAVLLLASPLAALPGCSSAGIAMREQLGYAKREQLVDRVEEARDAQDAAKKQFASALEEFQSLVGGKPSELDATYKKLKAQSDRAASRAETVSSRIKSVEAVSGALFKEWQGELAQYKSADMKAKSEALLQTTKDQYTRLIGSMKGAEAKMQPVLDAFNERVLFLKHNLNAQAVASLRDEAGRIEGDVSALVKELEAAINEANDFISKMGT
jgi:DNA repair exonuclease SbcCD ATPase subunit